jgi:hypothetical protein
LSRTLEERLEAGDAPGWKPEPGDRVLGLVVNIDERVSDYTGKPYPILTIEQGDGSEIAVHAFHTVLSNEISGKRIAVGDRVGVKYHGERVPKSGVGSFHHYSVAVERSAENAAALAAAPAPASSAPADPHGLAANHAAQTTATLDPWADKRAPRPDEEPF